MIRKLTDCLATILDEAVDDGYLDRNPARSRRMRVKVPKPSRTFLEMDELVALTDPARDDRARAVLVRAEGRVVSGGVDVGLFSRIAEGPQPVAEGGELWARLLRTAQTLEDLPVPTVFAAHALTLTAAF